MKVSASAPSDTLRRAASREGGGSGIVLPRVVLLLAALYALLHLAFLAPSLEDIDSINFALGLRAFDVAAHQPHPPGYPVYMALGRLSRAALNAVASGIERTHAEAVALALWSALASGLALAAAFAFFRQLGEKENRDAASIRAAALLAFAPLFWMSGLRPMSDMPGLALALAAQALMLGGAAARRRIVWGAFIAGIAAGVRVQTIWLTAPLLLLVVWEHRREGIAWFSGVVAAGAAGVLAWLVPLLAASGGLEGYLLALGSQAGEDFAWVDMLWSNPTPRRLAFSAYETFVLPWSVVPLASAVAVAAVAGVGAALVHRRRALVVLAVAFGPYAIFHLLFQETVTVRYALPTLPAVAWLAACGVVPAGRFANAAGALLAAGAAVVALPGAVAYAREPHPAFAAIEAMEQASSRPAAIYSHYALRRPLQARSPAGSRVIEPRRNYEWLGLVDYWRSGGTDSIWFLADPKRTDLALLDPHSRRNVIRYRWDVERRGELSGTRPTSVDWYRLDPPGWFAGEGWSLTPETGGIARATRMGVDRRAIEAWVLRQPEPMHIVIGGRDLSVTPAASTSFELALDGNVVDRWTLNPGEAGPNFLRFIPVPDGVPAGPGRYAHLTVSAAAADGRSTPPVAIRQFDIQPSRVLIYGYGEGWHEEEYENSTGRRWRWTSERSVLRVEPPSGVELTLKGESPLKYFDAAPQLRVTAGGRAVASLRPEADFAWRVVVPADAVIASGGAIAIESDRVYLPGQAEGTPDTRRLGVRLFDVDAHPVAP